VPVVPAHQHLQQPEHKVATVAHRRFTVYLLLVAAVAVLKGQTEELVVVAAVADTLLELVDPLLLVKVTVVV
jgi:hypothetical protein